MIKASSRIGQVLLNIILNASYAIKDKKMEGPGLITITTDTDGGFVRCRIEDNGIGMDKKVRGMIFYPFFTTKPPGQGTGLGLSIAYDIVVNQHGGQILVESKPMVGSCFTIRCRLTGSIRNRRSSMNKSILLVDDERPILAALKKAFAATA